MEFVSSKKDDLTVIEVKVTMLCKCGKKAEVNMDKEVYPCPWYPDDAPEIFFEVTCPECGAKYETNRY